MKKKLLLASAMMLSMSSLMAQSSAAGEPRLFIKSSQSLMAPVWSPDGSKIAVTGDNYIGIWVANADGSNLNQVSDALGAGYKMNWADAATIVSTPYQVENSMRMMRIENVNVETGQIKQVAAAEHNFRRSKAMKTTSLLQIMVDQPAEATKLIPSLAKYAGKMVLNPALSPDGKKIAFQIVSKGLFVCDVDGENLKAFGKGAYPSWAPNSKNLMFARLQDNGERFTSSDLYCVNTETGVENCLTANSDVIPVTLAVSPDGTKVAFDNDVDGNIYVIDLK
ncbi:MAG: hypothetical protein Q4B68_06605 [Bacteroidales bacterium]|nr:hypothetical protein [Bacteroidales bacterium]